MTSGSLGWWYIGKPAREYCTAIQLSQRAKQHVNLKATVYLWQLLTAMYAQFWCILALPWLQTSSLVDAYQSSSWVPQSTEISLNINTGVRPADTVWSINTLLIPLINQIQPTHKPIYHRYSGYYHEKSDRSTSWISGEKVCITVSAWWLLLKNDSQMSSHIN